MMDETNNKQILLNALGALKTELSTLRVQSASVNDLFTEPIDKPIPVNLWSFSDREIEQRLARLLSFQNSDMDPHPLPHHITSHRPRIGPFIVRIKRFIMKLFRPISGPLLTPQQHFNQMEVEYNLGCFIRLGQLDQRISKLEEAVQRIEISILSQELKAEASR